MYSVLSILLGLCLGSIFYIIVKKDLADKTETQSYTDNIGAWVLWVWLVQ